MVLKFPPPLHFPEPGTERFPFEFDLHFRRHVAQPPEVGAGATGNRLAFRAFADAEWRSLDDLVWRLLEIERFRYIAYRYRICDKPPWGDAGRHVGSWQALGLVVEEAGPGRERGWRLVSRQPMFVEEGTGRGRRSVQIRGLPPEQQAARYELEERRARDALRHDARAREKKAPEIAAKVREILKHDPDFLIPPAWAEDGYVPEAIVGEPLDVQSAIVGDAHHVAGLDRNSLRLWQAALNMSADDAGVAARQRQRGLNIAVDIPRDDADPLESLL